MHDVLVSSDAATAYRRLRSTTCAERLDALPPELNTDFYWPLMTSLRIKILRCPRRDTSVCNSSLPSIRDALTIRIALRSVSSLTTTHPFINHLALFHTVDLMVGSKGQPIAVGSDDIYWANRRGDIQPKPRCAMCILRTELQWSSKMVLLSGRWMRMEDTIRTARKPLAAATAYSRGHVSSNNISLFASICIGLRRQIQSGPAESLPFHLSVVFHLCAAMAHQGNATRLA